MLYEVITVTASGDERGRASRVGSSRLVGEHPADAQQLLRRPAQGQLELARVQEVAVQRVVAVEAHAAVDVLGRRSYNFV